MGGTLAIVEETAIADDAGARHQKSRDNPSPEFRSYDTLRIESMLKTLSQCGEKVILSENRKISKCME